MAQKKPRICFIGLGAMGFGMATNLVKRGYPVTGFDISSPTMDTFRREGGSTSATASGAAQGTDFCIVMVATSQQVEAALFEGETSVITTLPGGAVIFLASTVSCDYVQTLENDLVAKGRDDLLLIDCPVSGGATRAADGMLSIMASGSDKAIERGRDLLQQMSDPTKLYFLKGGIGAGSNMKMCHQVLAANHILAANEAMGFASSLGLDLPNMANMVLASQGWSWMFEHRVPRMLDPISQTVASAVTIILKDTNIIISEASRAGFPMPLTSTAEQVYFYGFRRGYGSDDDSSLIRLYTENTATGFANLSSKRDEVKQSLVIDMLKSIHLCSAAEMLALAKHLGLDLDQVFELCTNAAGASTILSDYGREMIQTLMGGDPIQEEITNKGSESLETISAKLQNAIELAQKLKIPVFLGSRALKLMRIALRQIRKDAAMTTVGSIVKIWSPAEVN